MLACSLRRAGTTGGRDTAERFVAFVASAEDQEITTQYRRDRFGEGLHNDAAYARQFDRETTSGCTGFARNRMERRLAIAGS